jgi:hypothetical protein
VLALVILFAMYAFIPAGLKAVQASSSAKAGPVIGHLLLALVDLAGIAGAGVDGRTAAEQLDGERPAKPPVGPGDEDGAGRQARGKLLMK